MLKRLLTGLIVVVAMSGTAAAGPLEDADAASQRGDYATAMRLYRPLAEQGNAEAQNELGTLYEQGLGVPEDYAEAMKWYARAAEQGEAAAQNNLGATYESGKGVRAGEQVGENRFIVTTVCCQPLYVMAHMWFNLAAAQGDKWAAEARDAVAKKMTPDQIAEAQRMAREWKPTPAQ